MTDPNKPITEYPVEAEAVLRELAGWAVTGANVVLRRDGQPIARVVPTEPPTNGASGVNVYVDLDQEPEP